MKMNDSWLNKPKIIYKVSVILFFHIAFLNKTWFYME